MKRVIAVSFLLASCASANGLDGRTALLNVSTEPAGSACEFGGIVVQSGLDQNDDGALQPTEVQDTEYVCNGHAEPAVVTRASSEPAGDNCAAGGLRLDLGADLDGDGALGEDEIENTQFVCNGVDGTDGMDGTNGTNGRNGVDGQPGQDGQNGQDGQDGVSTLTSLTALGANGSCGAQTGVRIDAGPDTNANGTLDAAEVTDSEVVCDGADGSGSGGNAVIAANYSAASVQSDPGVVVTLVSVAVTVPGPGTVVAFGSTDAYCSSTGAPACATSPPTPAWVRVTDTASGDPSTGTGHGYVHLSDDVTENVTRSNVFSVAAAGTYTYYLRGRADFGAVGFYRNQINAVFVPN